MQNVISTLLDNPSFYSSSGLISQCRFINESGERILRFYQPYVEMCFAPIVDYNSYNIFD